MYYCGENPNDGTTKEYRNKNEKAYQWADSKWSRVKAKDRMKLRFRADGTTAWARNASGETVYDNFWAGANDFQKPQEQFEAEARERTNEAIRAENQGIQERNAQRAIIRQRKAGERTQTEEQDNGESPTVQASAPFWSRKRSHPFGRDPRPTKHVKFKG